MHPELVDEWVPEMNEVDIASVTSASTRPAVWRCAICGHVYSLSPRRRVQLGSYACPRCHGAGQATSVNSRLPSKSENDAVSRKADANSTAVGDAMLGDSFASAYPHLVQYWDAERNGALSPYQVPKNSTMTIWWRWPGNQESSEGLEERFQRPLSAFVEDCISPRRKLIAKAALEDALLEEIRQVSTENPGGIATGHGTKKLLANSEVSETGQAVPTKDCTVSVEECRALLQRDWYAMIDGIRDEIRAYHDQQNALARAHTSEEEDAPSDESLQLGDTTSDRPSSYAKNTIPSRNRAANRLGGNRYLPHTVLATQVGQRTTDFFLFSRTSRSVLPSFRSTTSSPSSVSSATISEKRYQERFLIEQKARELELLIRIHDAQQRVRSGSEEKWPNLGSSAVFPDPVLFSPETWKQFFNAAVASAQATGGGSSPISDDDVPLATSSSPIAPSSTPTSASPTPSFRVKPFGSSAQLHIGDEPQSPPEVFPSSVRVPFPMPPTKTSLDEEGDEFSVPEMEEKGSQTPSTLPPGPSTTPLTYPKAPRRMPVIPEEDVLAATPRAALSTAAPEGVNDGDRVAPLNDEFAAPSSRSHDLLEHVMGATPQRQRQRRGTVSTEPEPEEEDAAREASSFAAAYQQAVEHASASPGEVDNVPPGEGVSGQRNAAAEASSRSMETSSSSRHPVYDRTTPEPRRVSNSFRLRLPRGNPSGNAARGADSRSASPSVYRPHGDAAGRVASAASHSGPKSVSPSESSTTPTLQGPRAPRKVARPKRVAVVHPSPASE